jgi:hypothetical protein
MDVRPASRVPRIGMPLLLVFLLVALPAAAQSSLPTLLLDEQPVAQPAVAPVGGGFPSAVATDGTNFLIVSTTVLKLMALGQVAMLVDSSGRPLLDTSVHLPSDGGDYTAIAVWNGRIYLVVMRSYKDAPMPFESIDRGACSTRRRSRSILAASSWESPMAPWFGTAASSS